MTAALEGGEWSAACPGRTLPPGKTRYPFYKRLGGPQGRSGRAENLVPTGIRSRSVQPVAQSLYRLSYPAHKLRKRKSEKKYGRMKRGKINTGYKKCRKYKNWKGRRFVVGLLFCWLFDEVVKVSGQEPRMKDDKWKLDLESCGRKQSWIILRRCSGTCLEGLEKTTKFSYNNPCLCRDTNKETAE